MNPPGRLLQICLLQCLRGDRACGEIFLQSNTFKISEDIRCLAMRDKSLDI